MDREREDSDGPSVEEQAESSAPAWLRATLVDIVTNTVVSISRATASSI